MQALHLLPISLNLQDKRCVVVGGGSGAEKRVRSLLACGAAVQVVSPALTPWPEPLAKTLQIAIQLTEQQVWGLLATPVVRRFCSYELKIRQICMNIADSQPAPRASKSQKAFDL